MTTTQSDADAPVFSDSAFERELAKIGRWAVSEYYRVRAAPSTWEVYVYEKGNPPQTFALVRPFHGTLAKIAAPFTPRSFAALMRYSLDSGDESIFATLRTYLDLLSRGLAAQAATMIDERDL